MLTVYHSNRLETLAEQLAEIVRQPCGSLFLPEMVIVQSAGMARWLSLHLAQRLGICARIRFPFPAAFIWELFRGLLRDIPETSSFAPEILVWRLMALLEELEESPPFGPLHAYCGDDDGHQRFELARRLADLFDQYLVYRPDWIRRWEQGDETHWQAELWRRLSSGSAAHRVRLHEQFLNALTAEQMGRLGLPPRVSFIGIPTMPPLHLEIVARLAAFIDVYGFVLNPCREGYWKGGTSPDSTTSNRLLASMGRLGRDFIGLIQPYNPQVITQFTEPGAESLLHALQADILNDVNHDRTAGGAMPVPIQDRSVQVHVCHSRLREVEVLHDQLLGMFEADPDLQPADIIVMTPDIDAYAPLIEAVFASGDRERSIPFSITDRSPRAESPLLSGFLTLLDLPGSRYDANRLYSLLEIPALQRRFAFAEPDLTLVHRWLRDTGIRWGVDQDSRATMGLPATREHTWRAGLDRLLMGYALPGHNRQLFAEILPYDAVEGSDAQVLGRLYTFAEAAFGLSSALQQPRPVVEWRTVLGAVLEQFFQPDETEEPEAQAVRNALQQLVNSVQQSSYGAPVPFEVIKSCLQRALGMQEWSIRFLTGGVTFGAMVPMRSIPCQVVCLLGMSYDQFPRLHRALSFDRMAQDDRPGDRSRRHDDRYLFLEALLSARTCLYLSYVGRNIRDNSLIPPSVLVSELLDAITQGFQTAEPAHGDVLAQMVTQHPLQAFSRRYFCGDARLFSYAETLCEASRLAGRAETLPVPLVTVGLSAPDETWRTVDVQQLVSFFQHPTRYFVQQCLGIHLEDQEERLETREPFTLQGLSRYALRQEVLQRHLDGEPPESIQRLVCAAALLPHGEVGAAIFEQEWPGITRFAERLQQILLTMPRRILDIDLHLGTFRLTGQLADVTPQGLVGYHLGRVRPRDQVNLWIRHLVLNGLAPADVPHESRWLGEDKELLLPPVVNAQPTLQTLLDCYWQGLQRPLPFFPDSALAYAKARHKETPDPLRAARGEWESSDYHRGESEDRYYQMVFRDHDPLDEAFVDVAEAVLLPLLAYVQEA